MSLEGFQILISPGKLLWSPLDHEVNRSQRPADFFLLSFTWKHPDITSLTPNLAINSILPESPRRHKQISGNSFYSSNSAAAAAALSASVYVEDFFPHSRLNKGKAQVMTNVSLFRVCKVNRAYESFTVTKAVSISM